MRNLAPRDENLDLPARSDVDAKLDTATAAATYAPLDHLTDTADAHDASAISFTPAGTIAATNVQDAIAEVATEAGVGGGGVNALAFSPGQFFATGGSPSIAHPGDTARLVTINYDQATAESASIQTQLPSDWTTFDVQILWRVTAGTGNVQWEFQYQGLGDGDSTNAADSVALAVTVAAPAANIAKLTTLATGITVPAGVVHKLEIVRNANAAADTHNSDAGVITMILTKAS